ncbi:DUF4179 domain-containing protein [Paenibacillus sp. MABNR03]|uniref:DUF4179 domain-containing protein n=1 Tax=Paenibacillus sp. MABNR03 TaxID=3142626 RepID=UPI003D2DCD30
MEKWERQLKSKVNHPFPEEMDELIDQTLNKLTKKHKKNHRPLIYTLIAVVASLAITVGMTSLSPAFADAMKSIPLIGSVFELGGEDGVKRGSQLGLSQKFNQQVRIGDQEVTFTESLYDGSNIHLGWVATDHDKNIFGFQNNISFTVNGKRISNYAADGPALYLENGTYAGRLQIDPNEKLPDKFTLGILSLDETAIYAEIPIELQGSYQTIPIAKSGTWNGTEMIYDELSLYPTTTELSFHMEDTDSSIGTLKFQMKDEHGHVLRTTSNQGWRTPSSGEYKYNFEPFESLPDKVTITPYTSTAYTTAEINVEWKGKPLTVPQGEVGSLIILDQKLEDNKLTLTFEVTGERIYEQVRDIGLNDRTGNPFPRVSPPIRIQGSDKYEITFSDVISADSIQITTPMFNPTNYLRDLEVTVHLRSLFQQNPFEE